MKWPATRISSSSPKSFGMYEQAVKLFGHDADVIHLEVGRPDFDTPAHVKAALTQTTLSIPITRGAMALGTWQGIYLFEHRRAPHKRQVLVHIAGA